MNYKYKKGQIFGKKLKVPKDILNNIYDCVLSFSDFIKYDLEDKIPLSCIRESDRQIVEKFGVEKCKSLDWELIYTIFTRPETNGIATLMELDPQTEDINKILYELLVDKLKPDEFSSKMKKIYQDKVFDTSNEKDYDKKYLMVLYNNGSVSLIEIIQNWSLFKNKDLSYCLSHDNQNTYGIKDKDLKDFMKSYENLSSIIINNDNIYSFIDNLSKLTAENEKKEYIKSITDNILSQTYTKNENEKIIILSDEEYKEIFKYSKIEEHLKKINKNTSNTLIEELKTLDVDYLFNSNIPISILFENDVIGFINKYGIKNVIDFDNECGHFFTNNNCEMLRLMYDMYLHYNGNIQDPEKTFSTKDENDQLYTKDEFYEAMRRMIVYGPSDSSYKNNAPDYRNITGEFRTRNQELFISEEAPKELRDLFYSKSLTPQLLLEHPEYKEYLRGKDLSSCFKDLEIRVYDNNYGFKYENAYRFLSKNMSFDAVIDFITEYCDVLNIIYDNQNDLYEYDPKILQEDSIEQIKDKLIEQLRKKIVNKILVYPEHIPKKFIEKYPTMFLSKDAPKELQEAFYNRTINAELILSNPTYKEYLKNKDLEVIFNMPETKYNNNNYGFRRHRRNHTSPIRAIKSVFKDDALDVMLLYDKYFKQIYVVDGFSQFSCNQDCTQSELLDIIDDLIFENIKAGNVIFDENMPSHFKNRYPSLFLSTDVNEEIKNKYYNRKLSLDDFVKNPQLLDIFDNTNIACGFPLNMSWIISLFSNEQSIKIANYNRFKIITEYSKITDFELQQAFKEYIEENSDNIDFEKVEFISNVLSRLSLSNSTEIYTFRKELATQILKSNNPIDSLNKIEDLFIKNNIPVVGKIYSCFEILHPDFVGFDFETSMISPTLSKASTTSKKAIVFSDLIKASFGSNNRSIKSYLKNIEIGSKLFERIKNKEIEYDSLNEEEKKELLTFSKHLITLFNNTMQSKKDNTYFSSTGDVIKDIQELTIKLSPDGTLDYNLADRVIKMFCIVAGFNTLEEVQEYIDKKIKTANSRNRKAAKEPFTLEKGDFVKGIGGTRYLRNILQNGSVSKEFLGSSAESDATPLDTDLSMISTQQENTRQTLNSVAASTYGPIWFVLKNDDRFTTTRTKDGLTDTKRDLSKLEVFYTGKVGYDHYGIRTGFASSEINYILVESYNEIIGLEIAMNGFYIPVIDLDNNLVFSPEDYDRLRKKMDGLSYFEENTYEFSNNLVTDEIEQIKNQIDQNNSDIQNKRIKINKVIKEALEELGLKLKTNIDGDLTENFVELIDTGSTGRGTNKPGDGDFDFMMRLDKTLLKDSSKLELLKKTILKHLGKENSREITGTGDFRLKNVNIDNTIVDIDITFTEKTDKVSYSTDMAIQDRLNTIKKNNPEKYKYVIANILLAKSVLKEAKAYKPNRGDNPEGGLGGVGIENWILQNGGSFIDAAKDFIKNAEGKSFNEFRQSYQIWDFGDNHLAEKRGHYPHDNFINNMSEEGYNKMVSALKDYLKSIEKNNNINIKR